MQPPRKSFVFAPAYDEKPNAANPNGRDATGGFHVGMKLWKQKYEKLGGTVVTCVFDNRQNNAARRAEILTALQRGCGGTWYDAFVYFGHGIPKGLPSAGFYMDDIGTLADAIYYYCDFNVKVLLYACSAGAPGGFTYRLGDELGFMKNYGFAAYSHALDGHTFTNPTVRRFPSNLGQTGVTVAPAGKIAQWIKAMENPKRELWAEFPFMTDEEIRNAV
jgi:hypothetical protein